MNCHICGRENRAGAKFCDACGAKLQAAASQANERRQLTALFCDIVDYSRLSTILQEEDLHNFIRAYRQIVSEIIVRWGGFVEFFAGDGVSAFFGYPHLHEDDAERAVRASLEIVEGLNASRLKETLATPSTPWTLEVRIGVHTGPVVLSELSDGQQAEKRPLGPTLNIAARLQAVASAGSVVIGGDTERLVRGMFVTEDLGVPSLKGIEEAVRAYAVVSSTGSRRRFDAQPDSQSPMIGRERVLAGLEDSWRQVQKGQGQAVLMTGEAGIGKSRLVRHFINLVTAGGGQVFEWRCSPFHDTTPFYPLLETFGPAQVALRGSARDRVVSGILDRLADGRLILPAPWTGDEAANLLADLVAPSTVNESAGLETPLVRRKRTLRLLCDLARAQAQHTPTLMIVDDLHWSDPSTLDLLGLLLERSADVPLLLLFTSRPGFDPAWQQAEQLITLTLEPLTAAESGALFDALATGQTVPASVRDELIARSDGVPLFLEELARSVLEAQSKQTGPSLPSVPATLRGLLASRLDRLSPQALETIHLAAAFSREFRFDLLASVSEKPVDKLQADLDELGRFGLLYPRGDEPTRTFVFRHALLADVAYDSVLRTERRRLHTQIAHRLRDAFPALVDEQPELLAHHFGEAGEPETALELWKLAGDGAIARGAAKEAVQHFDRGLRLLSAIADEHTRIQGEIELTESKGTALFSMLGYTHPEVVKTFAHASSLCERDGSTPTLRVLYGLWVAHTTRSSREAMEALLPRLRTLATTTNDPVALLTAHAADGVYSFLSGDFDQSVQCMTQATQWYATSEHSAFLKRHGYGGGLYPFAWRLWALSILGRSEQAQAASRELQQLADEARNPYGFAIARGFRLLHARERRDLELTCHLATEQIAYTKKQELPFWEGPAHCSLGWALARQGNVAEGIAEIGLGLYYLDAIGLRTTYAYQLGGLADALLAAGDAQQALAAVQRGLTMGETTLDRFFEAELLRLEGECHRRLGAAETAEASFNRALDLATRQGAMLYAVRAANSLAALLMEQGKGDRARQQLEAVLPQIAQGADMGDVVEARQLLSALA